MIHSVALNRKYSIENKKNQTYVRKIFRKQLTKKVCSHIMQAKENLFDWGN